MVDQLPRPVPIDVTRPFWDGLAVDEIRLQQCRACAAWVFYPRPRCSTCLSDTLDWHTVSGRGTVYTYTVARQATHPAFADQVPQPLAIVELAEGKCAEPLTTSEGRRHVRCLRIGLPEDARTDLAVTASLFAPAGGSPAGRSSEGGNGSFVFGRDAPSVVRVTNEEVDGDVDDGGRDDVFGVGDDGKFAGGQLAGGGDGVVDRAEVVAVAGEDEGRHGDRAQVVEGVARRSGGAIEEDADVLPPVTVTLGAVVVGLHQCEHRAHRRHRLQGSFGGIRIAFGGLGAATEHDAAHLEDRAPGTKMS